MAAILQVGSALIAVPWVRPIKDHACFPPFFFFFFRQLSEWIERALAAPPQSPRCCRSSPPDAMRSVQCSQLDRGDADQRFEIRPAPQVTVRAAERRRDQGLPAGTGPARSNQPRPAPDSGRASSQARTLLRWHAHGRGRGPNNCGPGRPPRTTRSAAYLGGRENPRWGYQRSRATPNLGNKA